MTPNRQPYEAEFRPPTPAAADTSSPSEPTRVTMPAAAISPALLASLDAAAWHLSMTADELFATIVGRWADARRDVLAAIESPPPEVSAQDAEFRAAVVKGWDAHVSRSRNVEQATTEYLRIVSDRHGVTLSGRTLYNWKHNLAIHGMEGLRDRRHVTDAPCRPKLSPFARQVVRRYLRSDLPTPDLRVAYDEARVVAEARRWAVPSFDSVRWMILRDQPERRTKHVRDGFEAIPNVD
jgi:hypothetical protein